MSPRQGWPPGRPPWWPANEQWPPARGRRPPRPLLRLLGVAAVFWVLLNLAVASLLGVAVARGSLGLGAGGVAVLVLLLLLLSRGRRWGRMARRLRRLDEAARRLEAVDERRRSFLAELAHELRTPLAVIRAQAEAISDGVYSGDPQHVAPILEAAHSMEALVADLRTLAESDAGTLSLAKESVALGELVAEVIASQQAQAPAIRITAALAPDLPAVDADPMRIRRVLVNLLQNSITHTPAGGSVRITAEPSGDVVAVTVGDSGAGIDPELAERAFERFAKGPGSRGSGLGLSIAKDVVEAHGGTIALDSEPAGGTRVRFTLPVAGLR